MVLTPVRHQSIAGIAAHLSDKSVVRMVRSLEFHVRSSEASSAPEINPNSSSQMSRSIS